ncbi:DUF222 domain-containing protein [Solihabitans fulvus]|uniref:DUF222 domain-containing protein n=1 Tax=Solihabitans fulvus TaxID=1892852 RepID=A0A5B2WKF1_9PSEU|nr:HNH endonuclease signature motif containing protein [Solihabitans fulvus]KAA2252553.1 DUF222 domain-containing protein [Solihabitans fulvus]
MSPVQESLDLDWLAVTATDPGLAYLDTVALFEQVIGRDLDQLDADQVLEILIDSQRLVATIEARQLRAMARFAALRPSDKPGRQFSEFAADEIAPAVKWTRTAAANRLGLAVSLTNRLPATLRSLERGEIDLLKARALDELTVPLSDTHTRIVEASVLARAPRQTVSQLRQITRRAVLKVDPEGAQRRHEVCSKQRAVRILPQPEAMAELIAYLPAHQAISIYQRVDAAARASAKPNDDRSAAERRADAFVGLMTGGNGIQAQVQVTVAATTLAGVDDNPGDLVGYGAIPAALARRIAEDGTWRRLLTDPVDGSLLDYGRRTYRPPAALADHIVARDRTCRFPGCIRPAAGCDLDHTKKFPLGPTAHHNLGALCRHHHRAKHKANWRIDQPGSGHFIFTSPTGRRFERAPEPLADPPLQPTHVPITGRTPDRRPGRCPDD